MHLKGLTGLIDIEDLELTASRDNTIRFEYEEFVNRIIEKISPSIVEALDSLRDEGMVTSRFGFIKKVADIYGIEILKRSIVPWITIIVPPGNSMLFSFIEAVNYLKSNDEILISYGTDPWTTESVCRSYYPIASDSAVIVPVNSIDQPSFGEYSSKDEINFAPLHKHFIKNSEENDRHMSATFLILFLQAVSEAWDVSTEKLINLDWLRKNTKHLCIHLIKIS